MATTPVTITMGGLPFACVPLAEATFREGAALYVVLCSVSGGPSVVLDVGQSGELGPPMGFHRRRLYWGLNCSAGEIWICIYPMPSDKYTPKQRREVEAQLRSRYRPACGAM